MSLMYVVNPKKRKGGAKKKHHKKRAAPVAAAPKKRKGGKRRAPAAFKSRSYRKNPKFGRGIVGQVTGAIVPAAIAGAGALGVDVLLGYLPLPDKFKTGALRHVTRAAGAIALGVASGFVLKKQTADQIMAGGLTVAAYGAMRDAMTKFAPSVPLAALEEDDLGDLEEDLSALLTNERGGMGALTSPFAQAPGLGDMAGVFNDSF